MWTTEIKIGSLSEKNARTRNPIFDYCERFFSLHFIFFSHIYIFGWLWIYFATLGGEVIMLSDQRLRSPVGLTRMLHESLERRKFVISKTIVFRRCKMWQKMCQNLPLILLLCDVEHLALMEIFNAIRSFTSAAQDQHQMCFFGNRAKSATQHSHSPLKIRRFRPYKAKLSQLECCTFIFARRAKYPGRLMQISLVLECVCEKKIERLHSTATTTTSISSRATLIGTYKATKHIFISEGAFDLRTTLDAHFLKVPSLNNKLASSTQQKKRASK